jgi:DNA polymerase
MDPFNGILGVDIETSSALDIKFGAWAYSQHPSTVVYCVVFGYATKRGEYEFTRWFPTYKPPLPAKIVEYINAGGLLLAHNVAFEESIWSNILAPNYRAPEIPAEQWRDTQAMALAVNLPLALGGLAKALGCPTQKDTEGATLMKSMAKAEPSGEGWVYPLETPENVDRLVQYCEDDVGAMLDCYFRLPALSVSEMALWYVDRRINRRGVYIDMKFAENCAALTALRADELSNEAFEVSIGTLANSTSTPGLKTWLEARGVELPLRSRKRADGTTHKTASADKSAIADLLKDPELPADVRAVLELRREANKVTSLAKLKRVPLMVGTDNRIRYAFMYCGAHTGRWTSSGLQLHNLPKPKSAEHKLETDMVYEIIQRRDFDALKMLVDEPLSEISRALRSMIVAPPGCDLIAGDFTAIEACVSAWVSGQQDVLSMFHDGTDVYTNTARRLGSGNRQLGKVCVLALGYGMGAFKFLTTAAAWGVLLEPKEAVRIQKAWRVMNQEICNFWYALEGACRSAIAMPGEVFWVDSAHRVAAHANSTCLFVRLPSGRSIRYWHPHIVSSSKTIQVIDEESGEIVTREMETEEIRFFTMGKDKYSMVVESTYAGKLAENCVQAIARDLLGEAARRVEAVDTYSVVIHVHDAIGAQVPAGGGSVEEFGTLMAQVPVWALGCPVSVDAYRDVKFRG